MHLKAKITDVCLFYLFSEFFLFCVIVKIGKQTFTAFFKPLFPRLHLLTFFSKHHLYYQVFHGFGQAKFADGGSILGSSKFTQLLQLPLKMTLDLKVVIIYTKIIISLRYSKSTTHSVKTKNKNFSLE
jgi:hypothetical protein